MLFYLFRSPPRIGTYKKRMRLLSEDNIRYSMSCVDSLLRRASLPLMVRLLANGVDLLIICLIGLLRLSRILTGRSVAIEGKILRGGNWSLFMTFTSWTPRPTWENIPSRKEPK